MSGPVDQYIINGVPVDKSAFRADDRASKRRNMANASAARNADLTGQYAGLYIQNVHRPYDLYDGEGFPVDDMTDDSPFIQDSHGNIFAAVSSVPAPTDASLGGVFASDPVANEFLTGIDDDGNALRAQPSLSDLSDGIDSFDTDATLAANSDTRVPSQKAVKGYVASYIAAQDVEVFKGSINCSTNPNYPAADAGHVYRVSVAGKIGGASGIAVEVGDRLECFVDSSAAGNQATVGANWFISQANIDGAVVGPALVTDDLPVIFDGTSGKLVKSKTYAAFLALLAAMVGDSGAGGTKGLVPAPGAGDAAAGKYLKANGAWDTPPGSGGGGGVVSAPQGRLTLTSGTPVTTADVTGATTIHYQAAGLGRSLPVNGVMTAFSSLALALDSNSGHTNYHQSGKNFDLFVIDDAGTLRLGSGPSWNSGASAGSDTARGTGAGSTEIEEVADGIWVNKNAIDIRYGSSSGDIVSNVPAGEATCVGTFRTIANGQTEDSKAKRFLSNLYSQASRVLRIHDATTSWLYNTSTWRQFRATASNQVEFVICMPSMPVSATVYGLPQISTGSSFACVGIGLDSTSVNQNQGGGFGLITTVSTAMNGSYDDYPGIGYHRLVPLEYGPNAGTVTWFGSDASGRWNTGLVGRVWA